MSVLGNIPMYMTFCTMYMLLYSLCVEHGNEFPQQFMIKRIYHDVMYCKIDVGRHSASSPAHHSVKHLNQNIVIVILTSCFRGKLL